MKNPKPYTLPDRYELVNIVPASNSFQIKDLHRNVISNDLHKLWKLEEYISTYEINLKKLQVLTNLDGNSEYDVVLKPGFSKYQLYYKGESAGAFSTIPGLLDAVKFIGTFESQIQALNNREEISL